MTRPILSRLLPLVALACGAAFSNAALYDFAADFSIAGTNPNGAWSYGYRPSLAGARVVHTVTANDGTNEGWFTNGLSGDNTPSVFKRVASFPGGGMLPGEVGLHPGPGGEYASVLFTAPESGDLTLQSIFGAGDSGTVDLQIRLGGLPVYNQTGVTDQRTFDLTTPVSVTEGQTLELLVGNAGSYIADSTPISARINISQPVPEPATMATLALGGLALLRRRNRKA